MEQKVNAIQSDIKTLDAISNTLNNIHQSLTEERSDTKLINDIKDTKSYVDLAISILRKNQKALANIYQAPPPPPETF
ncbi:hypothetical protein [Limnofasciculus baicalensis]|uniref:Uncharacterized protein n=1 Tax=Limnofasciculus baicalensis BBK-W-15 TaxID=2699891 RepID=A0AAE3KNE2_9CYAN|nr:hypothetical protein [Limnofasciculus baicalensis]MCP2730425.1 hypothetical protein [Limnofasciculus baicalensis BBK-W-15]